MNGLYARSNTLPGTIASLAHTTGRPPGITWLHRVAGLNPATSYVLREWDLRGAADVALRGELIAELKAEWNSRRGGQQPRLLAREPACEPVCHNES